MFWVSGSFGGWYYGGYRYNESDRQSEITMELHIIMCNSTAYKFPFGYHTKIFKYVSGDVR